MVLIISRLFIILWSALLLMAGDSLASDQQKRRLETTVPVQLDYLLALPKDYDNQDKWPLLLFLHGAGERGADLDRVLVHGPPKLISQGRDFPMIVVSPQCPEGRKWEPIQLTALLDEVVRNYHVDEDRILVTGLSMGGFGAWELAAWSPQRFAAIAPICGGGEVFWVRRLTHLPVWAFHGARDTGVLPERSESLINALKAAGGNAKLTIYPEAGHDAWTETYNNPEFYEWLLQQRRAAAD